MVTISTGKSCMSPASTPCMHSRTRRRESVARVEGGNGGNGGCNVDAKGEGDSTGPGDVASQPSLPLSPCSSRSSCSPRSSSWTRGWLHIARGRDPKTLWSGAKHSDTDLWRGVGSLKVGGGTLGRRMKLFGHRP